MRIAAIAALLVLVTAPAQAFCFYNHMLYYETTLQEEFSDAPLVVRAKVVFERNEEKIADSLKREWRSYYQLHVEDIFKGKPPKTLVDVTEHNSGGSYLDVGKDYLLFLIPSRRSDHLPANYMQVNYGCGQSREWSKVSSADRERLKKFPDYYFSPGK